MGGGGDGSLGGVDNFRVSYLMLRTLSFFFYCILFTSGSKAGVGSFDGEGVDSLGGGVGSLAGGVGAFGGGVDSFGGGVSSFSGGVGSLGRGEGSLGGGVGSFCGGVGDGNLFSLILLTLCLVYFILLTSGVGIFGVGTFGGVGIFGVGSFNTVGSVGVGSFAGGVGVFIFGVN